ncbi:zinc finger protein CONSTANS-LIKE 2-like isoform X2 [Bidens hawaiensis]|uniref:zinc finger protein CONSTANS-LIKE 2-like isoform X2 n=1 Tax=Bidens hawaiensis TaxID=980011 RepID=UPI004049A5B1
MLNEDISSTPLCLNNTTSRTRLCDTCRSRPGIIFCEADLAYLCTACDSHIHAVNKLSSRHKRVRVCDACEQAPAAFICKADVASLCTTCDEVIHSANPLSRRHHRVPVLPIFGSNPWSVLGLGFEPQESDATLDNNNNNNNNSIDQNEDEAASWLLFDHSPAKNNIQSDEFLFNGDEYLELVDYNSCQDTQFSDDLKFDHDDSTYKYMNDGINNNNNNNIQQQQQHQQRYGGCVADSLVPVQSGDQNQKFQLGMEYETSNGGYGYSASLGDSVSMSSMEVGIVADSTMTEVSIDIFSNPSIQMPAQLTPMDREARVLRYREKKTRKFEKTIRYASRKAYAETRPRIQGRFAKRTNVDIEVDQMFSTTLMTEDGYYTVPSF